MKIKLIYKSTLMILISLFVSCNKKDYAQVKYQKIKLTKNQLIDKKLQEWMGNNCKLEETLFLKNIKDNYDLERTLKLIIHFDKINSLEFALKQIKNINGIWIKIDTSQELNNPKYEDISVLDYALHRNNKNIINLLKKYNAKTRCELLKENPCKDLPLGRD